MIEATLAHLGVYLSNTFEVDKSHVGFVDRELVYNWLSTRQIPIEMPIIAYNFSDLTYTGPSFKPMRPMRVKGDYNLNFTTAKLLELIPVDLSVSLVLVGQNIDVYFDMLTSYVSMINGIYTVEIFDDKNEINAEFECPIVELSSLSTPAGGKEGKDFDRGVFYVLEGTFKIGSYVVINSEDRKVIRRIRTDWKIGRYSKPYKEQTVLADRVIKESPHLPPATIKN